MAKIAPWHFTFALAIWLLLALAGCAPQPDPTPPSHPYAAELAQARAQATNPEIRAALQDGTISDAELARAKQIAIECFASRGVSASYVENDGLSVPHPDGLSQSDVDALVDECAGTTFDLLSLLRQDMDKNPDNADWPQLKLDCFKRFGLVAETMSVDEFQRVDGEDPPWGALSGDARGCGEDPLHYQGGRPDLTPEESGETATFDGQPTSP